MIPAMTNVLMDAFQYGLNTGTELGAQIVNDKFNSETQNCIKWQAGEPKESGAYLITTYNGKVLADYWRIFPNCSDWDFHNKLDVVAWCKLSDIKPYKEKTK